MDGGFAAFSEKIETFKKHHLAVEKGEDPPEDEENALSSHELKTALSVLLAKLDEYEKIRNSTDLLIHYLRRVRDYAALVGLVGILLVGVAYDIIAIPGLDSDGVLLATILILPLYALTIGFNRRLNDYIFLRKLLRDLKLLRR